jgi:probable HAF family extracellular repeat protein
MRACVRRIPFLAAPFARLLLAALAAAATPTPVLAQVVTYTITDLGNLRTNGAQGLAINASGQVVGTFVPQSDPNSIHAFRTTATGVIADPGADLGTLGGSITFGRGINDTGQATGDSTLAGDFTTHAFRTTATGRASDPGADLGSFTSSGSSTGWAINSVGQVTGSAGAGTGPSHAFRSTPNGVPVVLTDLGVFPGGSNSLGLAINCSGQVAGYADFAPSSPPGFFGPARAFRTTAVGVLTDPGADLGTLGGSQSIAYGINNSGQVTGNARVTGDLFLHAFRSTPNGQPVSLTDLGTLGGNNSEGLGINSFGIVVGDSETFPGSPHHAFIYDTQMRDLNSLIPAGSGWILGAAWDINDAGQITGVGVIGGETHGFRLTPVPEPSALTLLGFAAAACGIPRLRSLRSRETARHHCRAALGHGWRAIRFAPRTRNADTGQ